MEQFWNIQFKPEAGAKEGVPIGKFDELVEQFTDFAENKRIFFRQVDENTLREVVAFCKEIELRLPEDQLDFCPGITMGVRVAYTDEELATAPFLELARGRSLAYTESVANTELLRNKDFATRNKLEIGSIGLGRIGIRDSALRKIEDKNLEGLKVMPVEIEGGWESDENRIWELSSEITLPSMTCSACNDKRDRLLPGQMVTSDGYYVLDGNVIDSRIKYDRKSLPNFDIAFSSERFGPRSGAAGARCIVSQQFKQICDSIIGELEWKMVLFD